MSEALRQFVALIRDPDAGRGFGREVYVELGRGELRQGRTLDSLQAAYRVGARVAWRRISAAGRRANLDAEVLSLLAESIFAYIDELSADSVEGYAEAQAEHEDERRRRARELAALLVRGRWRRRRYVPHMPAPFPPLGCSGSMTTFPREETGPVIDAARYRCDMQAGGRGRAIRSLAMVAIAGQLLWLGFILLGGLWEPGYSEVRDAVSWRHVAHGWAYFLGAIALALSVFAMSWRFHGDSRWRLGSSNSPWAAVDRIALALGALAITFFTGLFFVAGNEPDGHYGLAQRLALVSGMAWIVGLAFALLDLYGKQRFLGGD